jgi:hypothetical protein
MLEPFHQSFLQTANGANININIAATSSLHFLSLQLSSPPPLDASEPIHSTQWQSAPKNKKKSHRCRNCKTNCYTERALRGHMIHCSEEPAPKNPVINNYTNASFNRHITAGNINPHQFIANADYLGQLHYYPSLNEQRHIHASSQNNDSTIHNDDVAETEHDQHSTTDNNIDFNDSFMENVDDSDDEEYVPPPIQEKPADHELDPKQYSAESALPSVYLDISM